MEEQVEFQSPPLLRFKYPLVLLASLFAAYVFFKIGTQNYGWGTLGGVAFGAGAFAIFSFVQGALPILNIIGLPVAAYFFEANGVWVFSLGGVSLVLFFLTQFNFVFGKEQMQITGGRRWPVVVSYLLAFPLVGLMIWFFASLQVDGANSDIRQSPSGNQEINSTNNPAESVIKNNSKIIAKIQQKLMAIGLDPGPIDGVMGAKTKQALKKFGDANGVNLENESLEVANILLGIHLREIEAPPALSKSPDTQFFIQSIEKGNGEVREGLLSMLYGMGQGMTAYDGWNFVNNGIRAFCPPQNRLIGHEEYFSILKKYVDKHPSYARKLVQISFFNALEETFPCK